MAIEKPVKLDRANLPGQKNVPESKALKQVITNRKKAIVKSLGDGLRRDPLVKTVMARAEIDYDLYNSCDFCGSTQAQVAEFDRYWYIWATEDMKPAYPEPDVKWVIICGDCDDSEMSLHAEYAAYEASGGDVDDYTKMWAELTSEIDAKDHTVNAPKTVLYTKDNYQPLNKLTTDDPDTYVPTEKFGMMPTTTNTPVEFLVTEDGYKFAFKGMIAGKAGWFDDYKPQARFHPFTVQYASTGDYNSGAAAKKSCLKPHWTELTPELLKLPASYGYLRLASERGGMYIDSDVDYGLFFSSGWGRTDEPVVKLMTLGTRENDIPVFAANDRTHWPPMAAIDWPDMKAPPAFVVRYVAWAFDQWRNGKSIQFGCYGAHGRTGTFLGGLLILADLARTGAEAEDLVHTLHCEDAIETKSQHDWLNEFADAFYGKAAIGTVDDVVQALINGKETKLGN